MSQSVYNQIVALTASTAATVEVPLYYERVIVSNETTGDVYVSTNGTAASVSEGGFGAVVLPGAWRMRRNDPAPAAAGVQDRSRQHRPEHGYRGPPMST